MGKFTVALIIFLGMFSMISLDAQVRLGAKAGIGGSNITKLDLESQTRIGFTGGLALKVPLESRYSSYNRHYFQPELLYSNQGETNGPHKRYINYITLPLMYQYYFSDNDNDLFIEIGPQFSYIVHDKLEGFIERYDMPTTGSQNQKIKNGDVALNFGFGYSNIRKYEINLRYQYGLIDMVDGVYFDNGHNRTSLLSLSLSYFLD